MIIALLVGIQTASAEGNRTITQEKLMKHSQERAEFRHYAKPLFWDPEYCRNTFPIDLIDKEERLRARWTSLVKQIRTSKTLRFDADVIMQDANKAKYGCNPARAQNLPANIESAKMLLEIHEQVIVDAEKSFASLLKILEK